MPSRPGSITSSRIRSNVSARARSSAGGAGAALHDVEAGQPQMQPHELADRRFVFDDEHATPQRPRAGFSHVDLSPLWDTLTLGQDSG